VVENRISPERCKAAFTKLNALPTTGAWSQTSGGRLHCCGLGAVAIAERGLAPDRIRSDDVLAHFNSDYAIGYMSAFDGMTMEELGNPEMLPETKVGYEDGLACRQVMFGAAPQQENH
jgi:hypothetical protein